MKVVIVGAGVMGLMQARELAHKGVDVVLLDKGAMGSEASWAGGGIISPLYPWRYTDPVTTLASWSQAHYPDLITAIHEESGIDPELSRHGLLMLSIDDEADALAWSNQHSSWLEPVDEEFIYKLEPHLRQGFHRAMWMSRVGSVRNPRLLSALKLIVSSHERIEIREATPVAELLKDGKNVRGVVTTKGEKIEADKVLINSGAWSSKLLGMPKIDIYPVKGQMLVFDAEPGVVNRVVLSDGKYVIPRKDGKVVAGSTMELTEFEKLTTPEARETMSQMAVKLFPKLADYQVSHQWAGLRPGSAKGIPFIGRLPDYENAYINAGHFRNGLVLAPASVRLMTSTLLSEGMPFESMPYDPSRVL